VNIVKRAIEERCGGSPPTRPRRIDRRAESARHEGFGGFNALTTPYEDLVRPRHRPPKGLRSALQTPRRSRRCCSRPNADLDLPRRRSRHRAAAGAVWAGMGGITNRMSALHRRCAASHNVLLLPAFRPLYGPHWSIRVRVRAASRRRPAARRRATSGSPVLVRGVFDVTGSLTRGVASLAISTRRVGLRFPYTSAPRRSVLFAVNTRLLAKATPRSSVVDAEQRLRRTFYGQTLSACSRLGGRPPRRRLHVQRRTTDRGADAPAV